jgi:hypothetical protein
MHTNIHMPHVNTHCHTTDHHEIRMGDEVEKIRGLVLGPTGSNVRLTFQRPESQDVYETEDGASHARTHTHTHTRTHTNTRNGTCAYTDVHTASRTHMRAHA